MHLQLKNTSNGPPLELHQFVIHQQHMKMLISTQSCQIGVSTKWSFDNQIVDKIYVMPLYMSIYKVMPKTFLK